MDFNGETLRLSYQDVEKKEIYDYFLEFRNIDMVDIIFTIKKDTLKSTSGVNLINYLIKNGWDISNDEFFEIFKKLPTNMQVYCFKFGYRNFITLEIIDYFKKNNIYYDKPLYINPISLLNFSKQDKEIIRKMRDSNDILIGVSNKYDLLELTDVEFLEVLDLSNDSFYMKNIKLEKLDYNKKKKIFYKKYRSKPIRKKLYNINIETLPRYITYLNIVGKMDIDVIIGELNRFVQLEHFDNDLNILKRVENYKKDIAN